MRFSNNQINMDTNSRILELLWIYKFLTISQFERLWLDVSKRTLYKILRSMKEPKRALIGGRTFRYSPKYWRVEDIHYLKPRWKNHLIRVHKWSEHLINMPIWNTLFYNDYNHRKATIDIQISIRQVSEKYNFKIGFYDNYYEWKKNPVINRRATSTRLELDSGFIRADSIFHLIWPKSEMLYCFELHNGYRVKKICEQAEAYVEVLANGAVSRLYQSWLPSKVLIAFEHMATLKTTFERLRAIPKFDEMRDYFLFTTTEVIINNPEAHRVSLAWKHIDLYN